MPHRRLRYDFLVELGELQEDVATIASALTRIARGPEIRDELADMPDSATITEAEQVQKHIKKATELLKVSGGDWSDVILTAEQIDKDLDSMIHNAICEENAYYEDTGDDDDKEEDDEY